YALGNLTFEALAECRADEGHVYRETMPRFHRTAMFAAIESAARFNGSTRKPYCSVNVQT
ncbi:MAG: hypothetical protein RIS70_146, partial [Planctomycetota bacterium]